MAENKKVVITLVKSPIGGKENQKATLKALGLNKGTLQKEFDADMITFTLPDEVEDMEDLPMQIILHTKFVDKTIIGGEFV